MKTIIGWTLAAGLIWFLALLGVTALLSQYNHQSIQTLQVSLIAWGPALARFIAGPLTLAIVLFVLFNTVEGTKILQNIKIPKDIAFNTNIQALLAIVLILAFAVSAIGNVGDTSVLKDIALVVVGFYFGTRKRQDNEDVAQSAAAGAAAGVAVTSHAALNQPAADSSPAPAT